MGRGAIAFGICDKGAVPMGRGAIAFGIATKVPSRWDGAQLPSALRQRCRPDGTGRNCLRHCDKGAVPMGRGAIAFGICYKGAVPMGRWALLALLYFIQNPAFRQIFQHFQRIVFHQETPVEHGVLACPLYPQGWLIEQDKTANWKDLITLYP